MVEVGKRGIVAKLYVNRFGGGEKFPQTVIPLPQHPLKLCEQGSVIDSAEGVGTFCGSGDYGIQIITVGLDQFLKHVGIHKRRIDAQYHNPLRRNFPKRTDKSCGRGIIDIDGIKDNRGVKIELVGGFGREINVREKVF
jgi:hypothetical protein